MISSCASLCTSDHGKILSWFCVFKTLYKINACKLRLNGNCKKNIDIGAHMLKLLENVTGVCFLTQCVSRIVPAISWCGSIWKLLAVLCSIHWRSWCGCWRSRMIRRRESCVSITAWLWLVMVWYTWEGQDSLTQRWRFHRALLLGWSTANRRELWAKYVCFFVHDMYHTHGFSRSWKVA